MTGSFTSAQEIECQIDLPPITLLTLLMFNSFFLFTTTAWFLASLLLVPLLILLIREWKRIGGLRLHHWFLLAFLAWFLLSFAFRDQPYGYQELVAYSVGPLAYLVIVRSSVASWLIAHRRIIAWVLSSGAAALSLIGLAMFPFEHVTRLSSLFRGVEAFSTFPNTLAMFFLLAMPFQVLLSGTEKETKAKALSVAMFFLTFAAFFLTFSRGAYLALIGASVAVVGLAVFLTRNDLKKAARNMVLFGCLIVLSIVFAFSWNEVHRALQPADLATRVPLTEDIFSRVTDQETSADQSTDERLEFWKGSLVLIGQHPWFGVGSDGFRFQYPALQTDLLALSTHPHNVFLKLAVENGIPAALLFGLFLALLFFAFLRHAWREQDSGTIAFDLALLAAFLAANLHLLTDYNLNAVAVWTPYWLVLILIGSRLQVLPRNRSTKPVDTLSVVVVGAVFLVSVTSFVQYRFVKSAQAQALSGDPQSLVDILTSHVPRPFQSLAYEEAGRAARDGHLSTAQLAELASSFEHALDRYPSWPELRIAYARLLAARGKSFVPQAKAQYELALAGNRMNNLDWHLEYLNALKDGDNALTEKAGFYHALVSTYLAKLRQNAHLTVMSDNPKSGAAIIRLFMDSSGPVEKRRWTAMNNAYLKAWRAEREKFQAVFPGTVVPE